VAKPVKVPLIHLRGGRKLDLTGVDLDDLSADVRVFRDNRIFLPAFDTAYARYKDIRLRLLGSK